jgi:hypothetical protein
MVLGVDRPASMVAVARRIKDGIVVLPGPMDGRAIGLMPGLATARRRMPTATALQGNTTIHISSFDAGPSARALAAASTSAIMVACQPQPDVPRKSPSLRCALLACAV